MPNPSNIQKEEELNKKLEEIRSQGTEDEYRAKAQKLGLPFSDLASAPIDQSALEIVPEATAREARITIILKAGVQLTAVTTDPELEATKAVIEDLIKKGYKVNVIVTSPAAFDRILKRYENIKKADVFEAGSIQVSEQDLDALERQIKTISDLKSQITTVSTTKLLEILLAGALKTHASDIHLEPTKEGTNLRYRLDGVLQEVTALEPETYTKALNRIKVLSRLKLNIHTAPQDGRFTIRQQQVDIEVRVSILPSEFGETTVMRLLDPRSIKGKLEDLGMRPDLMAIVKEQLAKPTGAILTTGPTGSGKTTTLYAFINYLNEPGNKIITIEDPIEYHVEGTSQTQVDSQKGYSFANGLRAIVRQDPDIILVGEIRDAETAEIALNAALTGHLVLSTIHTNDSAGTIPRLIDLKVNPQIIAPAIRMAMAQRLVRKLCPECKKEKPVSEETRQRIKELEPFAAKLNINVNIDKEYIAVGCEKCNGTGYKGRVGVFEAFVIGPEMERLILGTPSISDIKDLAIKQGMITMSQDAYLKVIEGATSMDEVIRILG